MIPRPASPSSGGDPLGIPVAESTPFRRPGPTFVWS